MRPLSVLVTHWLTHWSPISVSAIMPGHSNQYRGSERLVVSMDIGTVYSGHSHTGCGVAADPFLYPAAVSFAHFCPGAQTRVRMVGFVSTYLSWADACLRLLVGQVCRNVAVLPRLACSITGQRSSQRPLPDSDHCFVSRRKCEGLRS